MAQLLFVSSNDILPFTINNIAKFSGEEFLSKNHNKLFANLKWGDAIQINSKYKNENKLYWDNGWHPMNTDCDIGFSDYGILPHNFSIFDPNKNVQMVYFHRTIYHGSDYIPWNPNWFKQELISNIMFCDNEILTYFKWQTKKCVIKYNLSDILGNKILFKHLTFEYSRSNGTQIIHYHFVKNNFQFPKSIRKYVVSCNGINIDNKNRDLLDNCEKRAKIGITIYPYKLAEFLLEEILNDKLIEKEKKGFINQIFKSKYLYGDINMKTNYCVFSCK